MSAGRAGAYQPPTSPPFDLTTYEGYKVFLEQGGNSVWMVAEILRVYFPNDPRAIAPEEAVRRAAGASAPVPAASPVRAVSRRGSRRRTTSERAGQLALDLDGAAAAPADGAAAPTLFAPPGERPDADHAAPPP